MKREVISTNCTICPKNIDKEAQYFIGDDNFVCGDCYIRYSDQDIYEIIKHGILWWKQKHNKRG